MKKHSNHWHARVGVVLGLTMLVAACGGGGGGVDGRQPEGAPDNPGDVQVIGTWSTQRLGTNTNNLYPGNTYEPVGGEPPYVLWLEEASDQTISLSETTASAGGRGFATSTRMSNLPSTANSNATIAVKAGSWSMVAWTARPTSDPFDERLLLRLTGPSFDSGPVEVSSNFRGSAWDVTMALDENGRARAYWDEQSRLGVNGRFVNGGWEAGTDIGESLNNLQRYLVAPDGQGFLFYARYVSGNAQHFVRRISAETGLGVETRLDDAAPGTLSGQREASAEGAEGFTTVDFQRPFNATSGCLVVRRMVASSLQAPHCISVSGAALPNGNYVSLSSHASGHALLVWSTGEEDSALYAARRNTSGFWSAPEKLVDVTAASSSFSSLSGVRTAVSGTGTALLVYRATNATSWSPATARAMVALPNGAWSAASELAGPGLGNRDIAIAFNGQGVPGVLQLMGRPGGGMDAVMMSTWSGGSWKSDLLRPSTRLSFINSVPLSTVRLMPQGPGGWLAVWDEGNGIGDSTGYRELWAAEYR